MANEEKATRLDESIFLMHSVEAAQKLLGTVIYSFQDGELTSGRIVEVEAYRDEGDEACHAARGVTPRNEVMFRTGGYLYVYLIYGIHYCMNVVTETEGKGCAVLIRAIEPLEGREYMACRRKAQGYALTNGPGKVCEALGISASENGEYLPLSQKVWIEEGELRPGESISASARIGISKAVTLPWRFYIKPSEWVSKATRSS